MMINVMKIFFAGAIALTMVWFADNVVSFLAFHENDIVWSYTMRLLTREPIACHASYLATEILIRVLLFYYWRLMISLFLYMVVRVVFFYVESKNRRVSAVLVVITVLFFVAQFHLPIVQRPDDCYFNDDWGWGQRVLESVNEPSLFHYNISDNETIYRIVYRRNIAVYSVRIHLDHTTRTGMLYLTFRGYEHENFTHTSENMLIEKAFPLNSWQYKEIRWAFCHYRFWQTPTNPTPKRQLQGGFSWIIEGVDSNGYHAVRRQVPKYGNTARLGRFLFDYAFNLLREAGYGDRYIILW
ncbi:MAG: hypothetical protein FWC89_03265 [Defluviitaleaceae bacterium]|nr:hypothetical protein [Defluviitaleaceae bacterium]